MDKKLLKKYLIGDFTIRRLLMSTIFIYVSLALFAWFFSDRMIYQPPACTYEGEKGYSSITLPGGGSITARVWLNSDARYTILYNHGNAVDLGLIRDHMEAYRNMGFQVVSYDYPGYGTSDGRPSTDGVVEAAEAAFEYVSKHLVSSSEKIIIHGRSVGSGPAIHLATTHDVGGLILESAFVSAFRVQTRVPVFPFDKWRNLKSISQVTCPVLIIHGKEDEVISMWHGEKLFKKAGGAKMKCWIEGMSHQSITVEGEQKYWRAIQSLEELVFQRHAQGLPSEGVEFCELHQQACKQEILEVRTMPSIHYSKGFEKDRWLARESLFPNAVYARHVAKPDLKYAKWEVGQQYLQYYCPQCRESYREWSAEWRARARE